MPLLDSRSHSQTQAALEIETADWQFLRKHKRPVDAPNAPSIRTVDLFAGCGGTALGAEEACRELGFNCEVAFALDTEKAARQVYTANFPNANFVLGDVKDYLLPVDSGELSRKEIELRKKVGAVDLLVGGPPCQGHSDLNNYTRRNDKKNSLYSYMGRAAKVLQPNHIIIENVQGLPHDRSGVLNTTLDALHSEGYKTTMGLIDVSKIGVPQKRRRFVVLASRTRVPPKIDEIIERNFCSPRDVAWAIADLKDLISQSIVDTPSRPSADNMKRIEYLFTNDLYDLPNEQRPPCHRDKKQTYTSVYGRMRWDRPSQTLTSGFYSMCMGRYVHPERHRTITAHEAARLQFFPDYFKFEDAMSRTALARLIGNAVPSKLAYVLVKEMLSEH